jgi:hypothetical protein
MGRGDYAREVLYSLLDRRLPWGWNAWARAGGADCANPARSGDMPDAARGGGLRDRRARPAARETAR